MTGNVYAVLGGRDDVGVTTTAVALGASLAETAHRVAVVGADFEGEGVDAALDLGDPGLTLRHVLRGDAELDEALVEAPHGLQVLPRGEEIPEPTDVRSHALVRAADRVRERFDVVLVDLGAGGGAPAALALERADGAILASTPTTDARRAPDRKLSGTPEDDAIGAVADAATVARYHGTDVLGTVFTAVPDGTEIDHRGAADALGTEVLAIVPDDDAVPESAAAGASLLRHDPDSPAAMVYWELAARLADGDVGGDPVVYEAPAANDSAQGSPEPASRTRQAEAQTASSPRSSSTRENAVEQSSASPRSATPHEDAESHSDSSPASTPSRQDAAGASSGEPSLTDVREDAGTSDVPTETTSPDVGNPTDESDGASQNEFSWGGDIEESEADEAAASRADGRSNGADTAAEGSDAGSTPSLGESGEETVAEGGGGPENGADEDDDIDAAFKATMDKVREQREREVDGNSDDDSDDDSEEEEEDGGLFGIGG